MQRVRIGLTGLAFVFVLVLLGAVFSSPSDEVPITANLIERQRVPDPASAGEVDAVGPKEPLAELGVAPGNVEADIANGAADRPVAPTR